MAMNDISALHAVGIYWVHGHETADELARCGSTSRFKGPESGLGVSKEQNHSLVSEPAMGAVAKSWQYTKTCSRINLGTLSEHQGKTFVL
jgi:hypothetical protein